MLFLSASAGSIDSSLNTMFHLSLFQLTEYSVLPVPVSVVSIQCSACLCFSRLSTRLYLSPFQPTQYTVLPVSVSADSVHCSTCHCFSRLSTMFHLSLFQLAVAAERQVWKLKGKVLQDMQTLDEVEADDGDVIEVSSTAEWACGKCKQCCWCLCCWTLARPPKSLEAKWLHFFHHSFVDRVYPEDVCTVCCAFRAVFISRDHLYGMCEIVIHLW